ncbi:MAG: DNA polymerase-3 subunit gamma/tau [Paraglaciecola sp.]|jgi:DNA polymerase-3 subunit gamma/tau
MSNFVVSARKYRPAKFEEVVGQEHVGQTLKNALKNDHLAHAFLFCGPRGVGKTTCARILAKMINCQNKSDDFEPCGTCNSCESFEKSSSFNILELDAASNNSVEHIRTLTEQVRFQPQQGQYKIFIIDEVHMLSSQAFNAFLKTLEEPPPHAIFILATTEKHKIIPTILSRCQIFDFKRIQVPNMVSHLQKICKAEGIEAEKDALHIIAQKADGALRDALSIFDRIVSFSGDKITYEDVITNLNILDYDYYFKFTEAMLMQDLSKVMTIFDQILRNGFEGDIFLSGLGEHLRNLLVCKDEVTLQLLEVSDGLKDRYRQQANLAPASFILTSLNLTNDCDINYKLARNKRLHVEMALIKMTFISQAIEVAQNPQPVLEKKNLDQSNISTPSAAPQNTAPIAPTPSPKVTGNVATPPVQQVVALKVETPVNNQVEESVKPVYAATPTVEETPAEPAPAVEPTPTPIKKMPTLGMQKLSSLDLLDAEIEAEEAEEATIEIPELTLENAQKAWNGYLETVKQMSTKSIMKPAEVMVKDGKIIVSVGSKLGVNTIRQEPDLMDFMRKQLRNNVIELSVVIDAERSLANQVIRKPTALSEKDKYDMMKEINPLIVDMRKRFELKLERE